MNKFRVKLNLELLQSKFLLKYSKEYIIELLFLAV